MKPLLIFLIPVMSFFECNKKEEVQQDPKAKEVVEEFYQWYITDAYKNTLDFYQVPPYKKINDSTYIFDKSILSDRLNKIKYFSKAFKKSILDKLQVCNDKMIVKSWDYEPEPQFNIKECNYLWFDNWVGGQGENIDGFKILSEDYFQNEIKFIVEITIKGKKFTKSKVQVVKQGNLFFINGIELIWK